MQLKSKSSPRSPNTRQTRAALVHQARRPGNARDLTASGRSSITEAVQEFCTVGAHVIPQVEAVVVSLT